MTRLRLLAVGAVLALSSGSIAWADDDDDDWRGGRWQGRAQQRGYGYYGGAQGVAFERGYEQGLKEGRDDGDDRRPYNFSRHGRYREGDHGYSSRYGRRADYVQGYRRGFEQGYRDGYSAYYGYGRDQGRYGRDGRDDRVWDPWLGRYRYGAGTYDWQRDGRHRHHGSNNGWCSQRHGF
jgi:hypothetical protein